MSLYQLSTYRRLLNSGRLLPAGDLKREPDDTPKLQTVSLVWANCYGYWRQFRALKTRVLVDDDNNETQWVCLDVIYGVRWFKQSQIDLWQYEHQKKGAKAA